jgi:hypothetical protein
LTYRDWVDGIKAGRTVVSRQGHTEFLDLQAADQYGPGDIINMKRKGVVDLEVTWTSTAETPGTIELVKNGVVVARQSNTVTPDAPVILHTELMFDASGWVCARRMDATGHVTHTAPLYVRVNDKPIRASAEDARYFVAWIDNILKNIAPGGPWSRYFTVDRDNVRLRYEKARDIYKKIAQEASSGK